MAAQLPTFACWMTVMALIPVRNMNLVVPLAHKATALRTTETSRVRLARSRAVSCLSDRAGDGYSTIRRSTPPTTRSARTSTMATRTITTRTTRFACAPSADLFASRHADFSFHELVQAYRDCRRTKRRSLSALRFELYLEHNLVALDHALRDSTYTPGRSICFVITRPKPREVWAADFVDRIVHHLLYNRVAPSIHARFIADSCACIPGRGTLYGATRLERKAASITEGWTKPAYYLKCDLANFFVAIDKNKLAALLTKHISAPWWRDLAHTILFHNPRTNYEFRGATQLLHRVPRHKRLTEQSPQFGLPIGNLSSQFFANILLNELDQFVKHVLGAKHYVRYVDDFVLLHTSAKWLNGAHLQIEKFLHDKLNAKLNPSKTILQPVHRGIDFVGQTILPHRRVIRKRTLRDALHRIRQVAESKLRDTTNSYFGMLRQTSRNHYHRLKVARVVLRRGRAVDRDLTRTYPWTKPSQRFASLNRN
jgi:RNA-directed DNA polymerase